MKKTKNKKKKKKKLKAKHGPTRSTVPSCIYLSMQYKLMGGFTVGGEKMLLPVGALLNPFDLNCMKNER